jgi:hypothetical protein
MLDASLPHQSFAVESTYHIHRMAVIYLSNVGPDLVVGVSGVEIGAALSSGLESGPDLISSDRARVEIYPS